MATVTKPLALDETLEGVRQALLAIPGGGNVTTVALNLADAYDPTAAYAIADYCIKDNVLYKCNTAIPTGGEAWTAAHWTQTTVAYELKNAPVSVSGTTPTITALPGVRYVCGEVATLGITLPDSGIVDVTFESGSTATVLTITPPTGVTLKWANGFDPTALETDTTYEINIADGLGVAASWT